ncbi:hypothetical protein CEUSTIGMA_g8067.t1 [Chlamydomonas eustigma]|uniref:RING-type domain-containing protein n=1 Tax=Chlamydomonas eustigma TaxID=1157962 RepID=A0A250XCL9_9CHLO|nr:hypothetical protein CEUSTIGMA_g8067.t1 [Chlamydomonas eustigma]|eukprot:GAX80632.1 hypothetical protein CEUSTIGMA_g8067.t1 [Chlamydomonas eustigma]
MWLLFGIFLYFAKMAVVNQIRRKWSGVWLISYSKVNVETDKENGVEAVEEFSLHNKMIVLQLFLETIPQFLIQLVNNILAAEWGWIPISSTAFSVYSIAVPLYLLCYHCGVRKRAVQDVPFNELWNRACFYYRWLQRRFTPKVAPGNEDNEEKIKVVPGPIYHGRPPSSPPDISPGSIHDHGRPPSSPPDISPGSIHDHGRPPSSPPIFQHENPSAPPLPSADEIEVLPPLHPDHYNLPPPTSEGPQDIEGNTCKICMDALATFGFLHEGSTHLCACRNCAEEIVHSGGTCPVCRKVVEQIIQVFP